MLYVAVAFITLHIDGAEGTCGTEVLAGTTSDTSLCVDYRYADGLFILWVAGYHLDGS